MVKLPENGRYVARAVQVLLLILAAGFTRVASQTGYSWTYVRWDISFAGDCVDPELPSISATCGLGGIADYTVFTNSSPTLDNAECISINTSELLCFALSNYTGARVIISCYGDDDQQRSLSVWAPAVMATNCTNQDGASGAASITAFRVCQNTTSIGEDDDLFFKFDYDCTNSTRVISSSDDSYCLAGDICDTVENNEPSCDLLIDSFGVLAFETSPECTFGDSSPPPSVMPVAAPTLLPTLFPTSLPPTMVPTSFPPTMVPTLPPTPQPLSAETLTPTNIPTPVPSLTSPTPTETSPSSVVAIAGSLSAVFVALLALFGYCFWRRRQKGTALAQAGGPPSTVNSVVSPMPKDIVFPSDPIENQDETDSTITPGDFSSRFSFFRRGGGGGGGGTRPQTLLGNPKDVENGAPQQQEPESMVAHHREDDEKPDPAGRKQDPTTAGAVAGQDRQDPKHKEHEEELDDDCGEDAAVRRMIPITHFVPTHIPDREDNKQDRDNTDPSRKGVASRSSASSSKAPTKQKRIEKYERKLRNIARIERRAQRHGEDSLTEMEKAKLQTKGFTQSKLRKLKESIEGEGEDFVGDTTEGDDDEEENEFEQEVGEEKE